MSSERVAAIRRLLKGIETGRPESVSVISPNQYIQHNPQTHTGREGLAALFSRLSKTSPRVNVVRGFFDGDYVFGHTEYDFSSRRVGFEVFRFEGDFAVEHWDNIQPREGPNLSGHSMVDGPTEATDLQWTEANRRTARGFVERVLVDRELEALDRFVSGDAYVEHHPHGRDGRAALRARLQGSWRGPAEVTYERVHRTLAQGNFALTVSEGHKGARHTAFYDLFRLEDGLIVEHWDVIGPMPGADAAHNEAGKF